MPDKPLKIALLSVHSCPLGRLGTRDTGGMSVYIRELARELGKRGHIVDVYTRIHDDSHGQIIELGENARLIHLKAGENGLHKLALYIHLPDFACSLENFRRTNGLKYDLIYSHYWLSAWTGKLLQSWWNIPHVAMFHTLGAVKNAIGIGEEEPELRVESERYLIRDCQRIIAATAKEKQDIVSYYGASPEKIGVIPCGVNPELFRPMDRKSARQQTGFSDETALFVGRVEPLKGIDKLIMAIARSQEPGLRLAVIGGDGDGEYESSLKSLCRKLGVQDRVSFPGLVEQEELPLYYNAARLCVIPSYYESFGLVALESLACGTPVISTPVGIAEDILKQNGTGYLVPDNSPQNLAQKMRLLLSRPLDADMITSIRASVAAFSWSNVAGVIAGECRKLTSNQTRERTV
ncbi:MAG: glycosyltransferase [Dehalococcoidales bacterium]|nr:glycosyltransferase [Dehalococcoidales bacterium]